MKLFLVFVIALASFSSMAQRWYRDVDFGRNNYVPLYDCDIFAGYSDQNACRDLTRGRGFNYSVRNGGMAVSCMSFAEQVYDRRSRTSINRMTFQQQQCDRLSNSLRDGGHNFDCQSYQVQDKRSCETVKRSYSGHRFDPNDFDDYGDTRTVIIDRGHSTTTVTSTVINDGPMVSRTCDYDSYDQDRAAWEAATKKQTEHGTRNAVIGIGAWITGAIISSNTRQGSAGHVAGDVLQVGGQVMTVFGLIQLADATSWQPHLHCQADYVYESRRTVVQEQTCTTTRWYNQRNPNNHYYVTECSSKKYVTYNEMGDAWNNGVYLSRSQY